jgi:hypothetical protein
VASLIALSQSVVASRDHVACDLDDETVILSLTTGEYYGLNPVAAAIWKMIQVKRSVAHIRDALLQHYTGVTPEQCEAEVLGLVGELEELGLVELQP